MFNGSASCVHVKLEKGVTYMHLTAQAARVDTELAAAGATLRVCCCCCIDLCGLNASKIRTGCVFTHTHTH